MSSDESDWEGWYSETEEEDDSRTEERFPGNDRKRRRREEMKNSFLELEKVLECPQKKKRSKAQILMECMKCMFIQQQRTKKLEEEKSRLEERREHMERMLTDVQAQLAQIRKTQKELISTHRRPKRRRESDDSEDEDGPIR